MRIKIKLSKINASGAYFVGVSLFNERAVSSPLYIKDKTFYFFHLIGKQCFIDKYRKIE